MDLARSETSGLVLAFLASTLQKLPLPDRWELARVLSAHAELANDPTFPLLVWYGIQPSVAGEVERAMELAEASALPKVRRFITRQLAENWDQNAALMDRFSEMLLPSSDTAVQSDILGGMVDALRRPVPTS